MNNHRDVLGIVFNVIVILLLLTLIIIGLNKIGVYDLPDPVEKVLGTYKESEADGPEKNNEVVNSIIYKNNDEFFITASDITYENARLLLKNISPSDNYIHEITVEYYNDGKSYYGEKIKVVRNKGLYSANIYNSNSKIIKSIKEKETSFVVSYNDDSKNNAEFPKGTFNISDECSFILNADNFLTGSFSLNEASFSVSNGAYGGEITIVFDNVLDGYIQKEKYVISLDFGVVISAECYENDELIYKMKTKSIEIG